ncbi:MAG TPA: hypothetical protein PLV75_02995, partial [Saprospiraceae bacterium]|nr:hypothetical protein [Saprospiraceae bacterium]
DDLHAIILDANVQLHKLLGDDAFTHAWDQGVNMSFERMLEYAMEEGVEEMKTGLVEQSQLLL